MLSQLFCYIHIVYFVTLTLMLWFIWYDINIYISRLIGISYIAIITGINLIQCTQCIYIYCIPTEPMHINCVILSSCVWIFCILKYITIIIIILKVLCCFYDCSYPDSCIPFCTQLRHITVTILILYVLHCFYDCIYFDSGVYIPICTQLYSTQ